MRNFLAILICIISLAAGLYVGFWLMFVGGIVQIVEAVSVAPVDKWGIAYGIVRLTFASIGTAVAFIGVYAGARVYLGE